MSENKPHNANERNKQATLAKTEKDSVAVGTRVCPSKLSKRELEELYFALMDNNTELKKSLNLQLDKVRQLSTKVARLANLQKSAVAKDGGAHNTCCATARAAMAEQNISIQELKKANERMAERVRILNMRLCSARQFLRRASPQPSAQYRCPKCGGHSVKDVTVGSSNKVSSKTSVADVAVQENPEIQDAETDMCGADDWIVVCKEECKNIMGDLQMKISALENELSSVHADYSNRTNRLERLLERVQADASAARAQRATSQDNMADRLRHAEATNSDISAQLTVEKKKVAELETQLKSALLSNEVAKTITTHLSNELLKNRTSKTDSVDTDGDETPIPVNLKPSEEAGYMQARPGRNSFISRRISMSPVASPSSIVAESENYEKNEAVLHHETPPERSSVEKRARNDDSGFADKSIEAHDDFADYSNQELKKQIETLQKQLEEIRQSIVEQNNLKNQDISKEESDVEESSHKNDVKLSDEPPIIAREIHLQKSQLIREDVEPSVSRDTKKLAFDSECKEAVNSNVPTSEDYNQSMDSEDPQAMMSVFDSRRKPESVKTDRMSSCAKQLSNANTELQPKPPFLSMVMLEDMERDQEQAKKVAAQPRRKSNAGAPQTANDASDAGACTYTIEGPPVSHRSEGTSPDNTHYDISSIADSIHKNGASPEERWTSTQTDTEVQTSSYESAYLSEGEVPKSEGERMLSAGEKPLMRNKLENKSAAPEKPELGSSVEAALQAVSEELVRCRKLLQSTRQDTEPSPGRRKSSLQPEAVVTSRPERLELRKVSGARALNNSPPPKCIFTLHIGTVVLSDDAVISTRDKSLMLTWRFYEQSPAMTRMRTGRVVRFDFSTEYDVKVTDQFLRYLKHEEMLIQITEVDKPNHPFIRCALPLRDALLNLNQRVDMSLTLMAIELSETETHRRISEDTVELGVLDLWCMLRAQPWTLSSFHKRAPSDALSPPVSAGAGNSKGHASMQLMDDLGSYRLESDLELRWGKGQSEWNKKQDRISEESSGSFVPGESERRETISMPPSPMGDHKVYNHPPTEKDFYVPTSNPENTNQSVLDVLEKRWQQNYKQPVRVSQSSPPPQSYNLDQTPERDEYDFASCKKSSYDANNTQSLKQNESKRVTIGPNTYNSPLDRFSETRLLRTPSAEQEANVTITVAWLALNEESAAMADETIERLYVAYTFLGYSGADLETPVSLPKPKTSSDKCHFDFTKTFTVNRTVMPLLAHMGRCRSGRNKPDPLDCIIFSVVSEPLEDPLGLANCVDIGYAYLFLGDLLMYCSGDSYTEVLRVHAAGAAAAAAVCGVCGVLAVRVGGLHHVRRAASALR